MGDMSGIDRLNEYGEWRKCGKEQTITANMEQAG